MNTDLNICLINDSFPPAIDGVATAVVNYATIIQEKLGQATVVTPDYPDADDSVYPFPVVRYPSLNTTKYLGYRTGLPFSTDVIDQIETGRFQLIHTHCPITSTILARILRDRMHVPLILTYHTKFDVDIANAIRAKSLQKTAIQLLVDNIAACDEVWTVSRGAGENLRSIGYEGKYIVMPNGVDFPKGRVSDELVRQVSEGYDLPEGVPVFLYVGRMMWYKGIRITLDALRQLADSGQDFRMVFVGGGTDKDEIVAYTEELGLTDKVFFIAPIHDREAIRAWYCRADLFLFPSTFDTNGLVVREAAACGLASVLVGGSCAAEDTADGRNAFLIEENADSMASVLQCVCKDPDLMHQVGEGAAADLYISWEDAVKRAYDRYAYVLENYKAGIYPDHDAFSDYVYRAMGDSMDMRIQAVRKREQNLQDLAEVRERAIDMIDEIQNSLEKNLHDFGEYLDRFK